MHTSTLTFHLLLAHFPLHSCAHARTCIHSKLVTFTKRSPDAHSVHLNVGRLHVGCHMPFLPYVHETPRSWQRVLKGERILLLDLFLFHNIHFRNSSSLCFDGTLLPHQHLFKRLRSHSRTTTRLIPRLKASIHQQPIHAIPNRPSAVAFTLQQRWVFPRPCWSH